MFGKQLSFQIGDSTSFSGQPVFFLLLAAAPPFPFFPLPTPEPSTLLIEFTHGDFVFSHLFLMIPPILVT